MTPLFEKKEFKINELSTLQYKISTLQSENLFLRYRTIFIEFTGEHGFGSDGNGDSSFIEGIIGFVKSYFTSSVSIILDFRNLEYHWGDTMAKAIDAAKGNHLHTLLLVSKKCYQGLYTLIEQELGGIPDEYLFQEENEVIEYLINENTLLEELLIAATDNRKDPSYLFEKIKFDWDKKLNLDKNEKLRSKAIYFFIYYRSSININFLTIVFKEEIKFQKHINQNSDVHLNILAEILLVKGYIAELEFFCSEVFSIKDSYQFPHYMILPPLVLHFILTYLKNKINNTETIKSDLEKYIYCENFFLTVSKSSGVSIP